MQRVWQSSVGEGRTRLDFTAVATSNGLVVTLTGGHLPHVGAVAVAQPRPSLADAARASASTSVITLTGHHDDELARPLAHQLASKSGLPTVVSVGIHWDDCTLADIEASRRLAAVAGDAVLAWLASG